MAESATITSYMDVKLDLRERKPEFAHLKMWTRYLVKIEAIKFFPSFVKISFLKHPNEEYTNLIVRIHIPGLDVEMTTSRTKPHSFGLFWKHNRKICCIYLAFDTKLACDTHYLWMQNSIKGLEMYRQDLLLTRRASRQLSAISPTAEKAEMYQNLKNTRDLRDPLPKTPDAARDEADWLRRASGVSGIYEEIEPLNRPSTSRNRSRMSRSSIASGIYEEMRMVDIRSEPITEESPTQTASPPPLPPRSRKNTNEWEDDELKRSHTNPEQDFFKKKKHWLLFETMFGRGAKYRATTHAKMTLHDDGVVTPTSCLKRRDKTASRFDFELARNKRNSFSSPDLSNLHVHSADEDASSSSINDLEVTQESIICSELHSQSLDQFNVSEDFLNDVGNYSMEDIDHQFDPFANISQCIKPNFNISLGNKHDMSAINLVGRSLNSDVVKPVDTMNMVDGYVVMRPIAGKQTPKDEAPPLPEKGRALSITPRRLMVDDEEEDHYKSPITFRRETEYSDDRDSGIRSLRSSCNDEVDPSVVYENTVAILANQSPGVRSSQLRPSPGRGDANSPFYANIEFSFDTPVPKSTPEQRAINRRSVDEKVASYFPNDEFQVKIQKPRLATPSPKTQKKKTHTRSKTVDTPAKKSSPSSKSPERQSKMKIAAVTNKSIPNIYVVTHVSPATSDPSLSPVMRERKNSLPVAPTVPKEQLTAPLTPRGCRKYETLMTRMSPSKYFEKNGTKKFDTATIRRFASLPRFKKIDLSPLKIKINSVLQRHQTEGL